jgi:hypothetical protein
LLSQPAASQKVTYDAAPGIDFSLYKTYKWQRAADARYPDALSDRILVNAIDGELLKKGLTKTDSEDSDLYVIYQLAIVDHAQWSSYNHSIGWPTGQSTLAGFPGATTNSSDFVRVGWLIIDLYDVKQKKQVWQATATKTLGDGKDAKKMEKNAQKAMAKVFENYPTSKK